MSKLLHSILMVNDYQEEHRKRITSVRSRTDIVRGVIFLIAGAFFISYRYFGLRLFGKDPSNIDFAIGVLFLAWGGWKIYQGRKKDYFIEREDRRDHIS